MLCPLLFTITEFYRQLLKQWPRAMTSGLLCNYLIEMHLQEEMSIIIITWFQAAQWQWWCFAIVSHNSVHTRLAFSPILFSPITYNLRFELVTCNSCDAKVNGELNVERKMPRPILHRDKPNAAHYLGKQMQLLCLARYAFFQTPQMSHINREKKTAICWKRQCAWALKEYEHMHQLYHITPGKYETHLILLIIHTHVALVTALTHVHERNSSMSRCHPSLTFHFLQFQTNHRLDPQA